MATALRTPAVRFEVLAPKPPSSLPRMDIAGFVGFAASGPIDTPVAIQDPAQFAVLFGKDLLLARDEDASADVYANLGPAVRGFFASGGLRCWVVRVASRARVTRVPVAGLVTVGPGGSLEPATLWARSAGSWADSLSATTALASSPVPVLSASLAGENPSVDLPAGTPVAAGDLLRLTVAGATALMCVAGLVDAVNASATAAGTLSAHLDPSSVLFVREVTPGQLAAATPGQSPTARLAAQPGITTTLRAQPARGSRLSVRLDPGLSRTPEPGEYLLIDGLAADELWMTIAEVHTDPIDPGRVLLSGPAQIVGRDAARDGPAFSQPDFAERLTFDLFAAGAETGVRRLAGLGFAAAHPRWLGLMPSDEMLYGAEAPSGANDATAKLLDQLTTPRFALAATAGRGSTSLGSVSYPIVMQVTPSWWRRPRSSAPPAEQLVRNGLASFDERLFIDESLRAEVTSQVLGRAEFVRDTSSAPRPLRGLHSLLCIDEVTLVCVPDAVHRPWTLTGPPPADPVTASQIAATRPVRGAFGDCRTHILSAPTLTATAPDATGTFTLSWTASDEAEAIYVLAESNDRFAFSGATTLYRGANTSLTNHEPGAGPYFRVRAVAGKSESDWSNGVDVQTGPPVRAVSHPVASYSDATLLDVHRALLRAAAARSDIFAVLALPVHYREAATLAHLGRLKSEQTPAPAGPTPSTPLQPVPPLDPSERGTLSYGALYHPWPVIAGTGAPPIAVPPDGPAAGLLAAQAARRGAWIAAANQSIARTVGLAPRLSRSKLPPGAVAHINVLSQEPIGFVSLSQWTLSDDPDLTDINVRRLMSLLRRLVALRGPTYIFEPNDTTLVHTVAREFEALLAQLFALGAFAGDSAGQSYVVTVRSGSDPTSGLDEAQLVVDLAVAPSLPLRFLNVRLEQDLTGATAVGGT